MSSLPSWRKSTCSLLLGILTWCHYSASASEIVNSFGVWFIIMTTYAIMFMQIFGLTKYGTQATTEHLNFRSYTNAMISLVRFSTG